MKLNETPLRSITRYEGVVINVRLDLAELPDGSTALREVVEHPGGVAVLPLESDGTVWCVRQYRYPFAEQLLEVPAGRLESGENSLRKQGSSPTPSRRSAASTPRPATAARYCTSISRRDSGTARRISTTGNF